MKTFEMKTVIHFGDNALDRLAELPYKKSSGDHRSIHRKRENDRADHRPIETRWQGV